MTTNTQDTTARLSSPWDAPVITEKTVITPLWVSQNFAFASVSFNNYYHGYTVTFETAPLHYGLLRGTSLRAQLDRDNHAMVAQDAFGAVMHFDTLEQAHEFCLSCGVVMYTGKMIYHVDGRFFHLPE